MRSETKQEFETIGEATIAEAETVECSKSDLILGLRHIIDQLKEKITQEGDELASAYSDEEEEE